MNTVIREYLNKYITQPDPQFAVMLKGKWGCGKTYFIKRWMQEYKEKHKGGDMILEPLYVSLYGMNNVSQITEKIDALLHPLLYSQEAKVAKKFLKLAGKIVFKTSLDWNNDGKEDSSLETTLDSLSILSSDDKEFSKYKLLVFDDLERCRIEPKLLLGYINYFVEHGGCHVIIVGDETRVEEMYKQPLADFKEKTIGRDLEVKPDTDAAVHYFLTDDLPLHPWIQSQAALIKDVFIASGCNNLRVLRQSLYDFSTLLNNVEADATELIKRQLLAAYISTYCEYKTNATNVAVLKDWSKNLFFARLGDKDKQEQISALERKYQKLFDVYHFSILNNSHASAIIEDIELGKSPIEYVNKLIDESKNVKPLYDRMSDIFSLTNEEFKKGCREMEEDIMNDRETSMYGCGRILSLLGFFSHEQMYQLRADFVEKAKQHLADRYRQTENLEKLYELRNSLLKGLSSFMSSLNDAVTTGITTHLHEVFDECEKKTEDLMTTTLNNLTDDNVGQLEAISEMAIPSKECTYKSTSALKKVDPDRFSTGLLSLSHEGHLAFILFLSNHYEFGCNLSKVPLRYAEDKAVLDAVLTKVKEHTEGLDGLDRYVYNKLIEYIEKALTRCDGYTGPIIMKDLIR